MVKTSGKKIVKGTSRSPRKNSASGGRATQKKHNPHGRPWGRELGPTRRHKARLSKGCGRTRQGGELNHTKERKKMKVNGGGEVAHCHRRPKRAKGRRGKGNCAREPEKNIINERRKMQKQ